MIQYKLNFLWMCIFNVISVYMKTHQIHIKHEYGVCEKSHSVYMTTADLRISVCI